MKKKNVLKIIMKTIAVCLMLTVLGTVLLMTHKWKDTYEEYDTDNRYMINTADSNETATFLIEAKPQKRSASSVSSPSDIRITIFIIP